MHNLGEDVLGWFTDGSKIDAEVGVGVTLKSCTCGSKLTWDCKQSLRQLPERNQGTKK